MNDIIFTSAAAMEGRLPRVRRLFWTIAGSCALGGLYAGRISRSWIRFARLDMPLPGLGAALEGAKLVHISDLHCSPIVMEGYLRQIIRHVNDEQPAFVAITGDFVTGGTHYAKRVARLLSELKATDARVACLGNHDFGIYHPRGHGHMRQLPGYLSRRLFDAGVHTLRNQHAIFRRGDDAIQFVGVDDMWSDDYSPDAAFAEAQAGLPTVALAHNPDGAHHMISLGAHWVLSGHTHGNAAGVSRLRDAVFPVEKKHYHGGYYGVDGGHLYVNRGVSYARRLQLNKRPEVTVFTLRRA